MLGAEVRWRRGRKDNIGGGVESTEYVDNSRTFVDT